MTVRKTHRGGDAPGEPDLVTIDLGPDEFQAQLIVARLEADGVQTGSWNKGREAVYGIIGRVGGNQIMVRRGDLPSVQAAMADAGLPTAGLETT